VIRFVQCLRRVAPLFAVLSSAGCAASSSRVAVAQPVAVVPLYADTVLLRAGAQADMNAFAAEVARARGASLGTPPTVQVRLSPLTIAYLEQSNTSVVLTWDMMPPEARMLRRTAAAGGDAEAEYFADIVIWPASWR